MSLRVSVVFKVKRGSVQKKEPRIRGPVTPPTRTESMALIALPAEARLRSCLPGPRREQHHQRVRGINRMAYDITATPLGTIEWE